MKITIMTDRIIKPLGMVMCAQSNSAGILPDSSLRTSQSSDTETSIFNPLSAGDAFKRTHTVFPQLKFDRN